MTINSATFIKKVDRLYSDSSAEEAFDWIQSPISRQVFEQGNQIVDGVYMQVKPFEITLPGTDALTQEFSAWDSASDEALLNFEKENY